MRLANTELRTVPGGMVQRTWLGDVWRWFTFDEEGNRIGFRQFRTLQEAKEFLGRRSAELRKCKAQELASWLQSLGCYDCLPCTVWLNGKPYTACAYKQDQKAISGAPNQSPYTIEAVYCLGDYPAVHDREGVCYRRADDCREWYLAGHITTEGLAESTEEQRKQYHPFGAMFLLHPWSVPNGEKIDTHARKPYRRIDMTILEVALTKNEARLVDNACRNLGISCD